MNVQQNQWCYQHTKTISAVFGEVISGDMDFCETAAADDVSADYRKCSNHQSKDAGNDGHYL